MTNPTDILVHETQDGRYTAEWNGTWVFAETPFELDSRLAELGVPTPRDLYLVHTAMTKLDTGRTE